MGRAILILVMLVVMLGAAQGPVYDRDVDARHGTVNYDSWESEIPDYNATVWQGTKEAGYGSAPSVSSDRDAQRAKAIEKRDPALLPLCTEEDFANRSDPVPAKSMDPWDHHDQVGCRLPPPRPDQIVPGPPGGGAYRAKAIAKRDPALLPLCTDEDFSSRSDPVPTKSMDPWDHHDQVGCRLPPPRPDQIVPGPPSGGAYLR